MPEKKLSCAQPLEWPFELGFTEQILKILEDNSEHFRAFWETLFERERAKESPEIYFRAKSFRTVFEKRAPVYSLEAPLLGMAKSIYLIELNKRLPALPLKTFSFAVA